MWEWDPVHWDGNVWKDPYEAKDFEPSDSEGFISFEEVVSLPLAEDSFLP